MGVSPNTLPSMASVFPCSLHAARSSSLKMTQSARMLMKVLWMNDTTWTSQLTFVRLLKFGYMFGRRRREKKGEMNRNIE